VAISSIELKQSRLRAARLKLEALQYLLRMIDDAPVVGDAMKKHHLAPAGAIGVTIAAILMTAGP
jgi:hypothetical protein